jgi:hypothetical protein
MITVINGSDNNINVLVNNGKHVLGTNMQPLIVPELKTSLIINGKYIPPHNFDQVVYCEQLSKGIKIAGTSYLFGDKILGNRLYVTNKGFYYGDEGLLNKYFFGNVKRMLTVVSENPTNIRVGATAAAATVLRCGDDIMIKPGQSELYIINEGRELAINLGEILANYPVHKIVICSDATKTTYKRCHGAYDTQDLSVMYITLAGRIYYGGKCVYCPFSMFVVLSIILLVVIVVAFILMGVMMLISS